MTDLSLLRRFVSSVFLLTAITVGSKLRGEDARKVNCSGYKDCIELSNESTRVVLCPVGGRVLVYSWQGKDALYLDDADKGNEDVARKSPEMSAGRFDIGPEMTIPRHPQLWSGTWQGEITGARSAVLTSVADEATGTQLIREFQLAAEGSHLSCKQTIRNVSKHVTEWCHWSRTFALGNGICLIPLTEPSRFPNRYVMYEDGERINARPEDPRIRVRDGFLEILGVPRRPKLGLDSYAGWFAYLMRNDLMLIKRFPTFPDRVYNEVAGLTISIWYPEDRRVELEPIGPRERLEPGQSASFTEDWYLEPFPFPADGAEVDLARVRELIRKGTNDAKTRR